MKAEAVFRIYSGRILDKYLYFTYKRPTACVKKRYSFKKRQSDVNIAIAFSSYRMDIQMPKIIKRISKSQYLKGLQCPKALWFYRHRRDLYPEIPEAKQRLFDSGHEVGQLAQTYFKNGIEITEKYYQIDKAIASTMRAVNHGYEAIYEATACSSDGSYSRIDILNKVKGAEAWDLVEVKQSTGVKDYHLNDMALQRHAFNGAGYQIRSSILMHVNNRYVRRGELNPKGLFALQDCTELVENRLPTIPGHVADLLEILNSGMEPQIEIGEHCKKPFECDYVHHCWKHVPAYSVYDVFKGAQLQAMLEKGILDAAHIPDSTDIPGVKSIDVDTYRRQAVHADKRNINSFLDSLTYPIYYLDYETIFPAIPLYDNSSPYQQIPFQFSLHIQKKKGAGLNHIEFLHAEAGDPRPEFITNLIEACGRRGTILVYNMGFESRINRELGQTFPRYQLELENINTRMADLLVPFRSRHLYHPEMIGSASLKSVLPAFVPDLSYEKLAITDGDTASAMYLNCATGPISDAEKETIYKNLKEYCALDTLAEVRLLDVLYEYAG